MPSAKFEARASEQILQEMWEKWVFLAAFAGSTCLMRAAIGDIAKAPGGTEIVLGLIAEMPGDCRRPAASRRATRLCERCRKHADRSGLATDRLDGARHREP